MARSIGYQHLVDSLQLSTPTLATPAYAEAIAKIQPTEQGTAFPEAVAPAPQADMLEHLLFALKHEPLNLAVLNQTLEHVNAQDLARLAHTQPRGIYVRKLCSLYEAFTQQEIPAQPVSVKSIPLFSPAHYLTRSHHVPRSRWGVLINGLGTIGGAQGYCPIVRRTPHIDTLLSHPLSERLQQFVRNTPPDVLQRTHQWAYLSETESTYSIEREHASFNKAEQFMHLLESAHLPSTLSEDYLCSLQQRIVSNPYDQAVQFRTEQNWLSNGNRGMLGITYIPPSPSLLIPLMEGYMRMCETLEQELELDPVVSASLASFGLVFAHPFMDGNGRLSRFLFHRQLCRSNAISHGFMLPVSTAIARHEWEYLQALQSFSQRARRMWQGTWLGEQNFELQFVGHDSLYRYWDATDCVGFGLRMANQALEHDLLQESQYLLNYDTLKKAVNQHYDLNDKTLDILLRSCLSQQGVLSKNVRKKVALHVQQQEGIFDFIETRAKALLSPLQ